MSSASSGLSDSAASHIRSLGTKRADVNGRKTPPVNVHTLTMKPIVTRLTIG